MSGAELLADGALRQVANDECYVGVKPPLAQGSLSRKAPPPCNELKSCPWRKRLVYRIGDTSSASKSCFAQKPAHQQIHLTCCGC
jgi:hypothetical protein